MKHLQNKTILLISPQSWGRMFVSKHHYAIELAKLGNTVYFLNPPEQENGETTGIKIRPSGAHDNLFLIEHKLNFPYRIKFHWIGLFHLLIKSQVKKILSAIGRPIDIVWSFDLGYLYPFDFFSDNSYRIFHPVDEPATKEAVRSARGSQIIFSVTQEILDKYRDFQVPKYMINHGVADYFLEAFKDIGQVGNPLRVGISGNLLRTDIDRATLVRIIAENPDIIFECWGAYQYKESNVGGADDESLEHFIHALMNHGNVLLHGPVSPQVLAHEFTRMDAFLICYDVNKDQSKGTNYHKVMEYLSTGKVIISNNITTYSTRPDLVRMVSERENNDKLPMLFKETMHQLGEFNSESNQLLRIEFARNNSYAAQLEKIDKLIAIE